MTLFISYLSPVVCPLMVMVTLLPTSSLRLENLETNIDIGVETRRSSSV